MDLKLILKMGFLLSLCFAGLMLNLTLSIEAAPNSNSSEKESRIDPAGDLENFTIVVLPDTQYYSDNYP